MSENKKTISYDQFKSGLTLDGEEPTSGEIHDFIIMEFGDDSGWAYNGVPVEAVEQDGGGEGGSESCHTIFKIGDEYYRMFYSYYSHEGFDYFGELKQVKPVERMVTFYE